MGALWKYEVVVIDAADSKQREEAIWELGRGGWELVQILQGDYKTGDKDAPKLTLFLKREATHDINF